MTRTYSEAADKWLADRRAKEAAIELASQVWKDPESGETKRRTSPVWTHDAEMFEAEWRWLWKRFQSVGTPMFGFARRLQTSNTDVMALSAEQRCWVLALAFKYRRKVLFNPNAAKLNEAQFLAGIKRLAGKSP